MDIPSSLSHYRILESLGRGGMGEVFLAEDTRLRRRVAIKVLTSGTTADRRRIEREALAVAALNHPNIVTIHAVDEAEGLPFIVMEHVEGRPLAEILRDGPLGIDAMLRIGAAVCDAVGAAHERQIIHRDLKPHNVMVTPGGRVKVLDFGLATFRGPDSSDETASVAMHERSGDGRIMGTVAYMSPEQAEGKPLDARSDIFSLGVMLHEMATGERPFKGDTTVSLISSILRDTPPPVTQVNPALPARLGRIVARTLAKDPAERYQHAFDLRNELQDLREELASGSLSGRDAVPSAPRRFTKASLAVAAAALAIVAAAFGAYRYGPAREKTAPAFEIAGMSRLTSAGTALLGAISPDGRYVVHVKLEEGRPALWVRQTATTSDVQIVAPGDSQFLGMTFSRDGDYVYYTAAAGEVGTLFRVPALGGVSQRVLENIDSRVTFSPDGRQLAFMRGSPVDKQTYLMIGSVDGSGIRKLSQLEAPYQFELEGIAWSPDGATLLATGRSVEGGPHDVPFRVDVSSGKASPIGERWALANELEWLPDGRSFMLVGATFSGVVSTGVWQVSFPDGARRAVTTDLARYIGISVDRDGRSLATVRIESESSIWVAPSNAPGEGRKILEERGIDLGFGGVAWTRDGRIIYPSTRSGQYQLWIAQSDGSGARQLTDLPLAAIKPAVSPDGTTVYFEHQDAKRIALASVSIGGGSFREVVTGALRNATISPDGRWLYYGDSGVGMDQLYRVAPAGGTAQRLSDEIFLVYAISPDGSLATGLSWDEAEKRLTLAVLPIAGGAIRRLTHPAVDAAFTPDGKSVVYVTRSSSAQMRVYRQSLGGGEPALVGEIPEPVFSCDWSADGERVVLLRGTSRSDVVVLSGRGPAPGQ